MKLPFLKSKDPEHDLEGEVEDEAEDPDLSQEEPEEAPPEEGEEGNAAAERVWRWAVGGAASLAGLLVVAIGVWWILASPPGDASDRPGMRVVVDLPLRPEPVNESSAEGAPGATPDERTDATESPASGVAVSPVTAATYEHIPPPESVASLQTQSDPALLEASPHGQLPRIAENGRRPLQAYARPFDGGGQQPRVVLIIAGLGLSEAATDAAILRLPGAVTLCFDPYAADLEVWTSKARRGGHEVLLDLPMEPVDFPDRDPGPGALMTSLSAEENRDRLHHILGRVTGYAGVITTVGSRFAASSEQLRPVLEELRDRGLLFVDALAAEDAPGGRMARQLGLPRVVADLTLDEPPTRAAITANLAELEAIARRKSIAVGVASPYPVTLELISAWIATFAEKNLLLAPATAIADKQVL